MATQKGSLFAGIKNASITGGNGKFFGPGEWEVKILSVKSFLSQAVNGKPWFAVECEVLSFSPEALVTFKSDAPRAPEVGEEISWLVDMTQKSALGNIKGFVKAVSGKEEHEIDETDAEALCGEDQPAAGLELHITAYNTKTSSGNDFTVCRWRLAGEDAEGEPTA